MCHTSLYETVVSVKNPSISRQFLTSTEKHLRGHFNFWQSADCSTGARTLLLPYSFPLLLFYVLDSLTHSLACSVTREFLFFCCVCPCTLHDDGSRTQDVVSEQCFVRLLFCKSYVVPDRMIF